MLFWFQSTLNHDTQWLAVIIMSADSKSSRSSIRYIFRSAKLELWVRAFRFALLHNSKTVWNYIKFQKQNGGLWSNIAIQIMPPAAFGALKKYELIVQKHFWNILRFLFSKHVEHGGFPSCLQVSSSNSQFLQFFCFCPYSIFLLLYFCCPLFRERPSQLSGQIELPRLHN